MMSVWFYVVDAAGEIVRFGVCHAEDSVDQAGPGETTKVFETDPGFTDASHVFDFATGAFNPRPPVHAP
jgi:hypothetical protein